MCVVTQQVGMLLLSLHFLQLLTLDRGGALFSGLRRVCASGDRMGGALSSVGRASHSCVCVLGAGGWGC